MAADAWHDAEGLLVRVQGLRGRCVSHLSSLPPVWRMGHAEKKGNDFCLSVRRSLTEISNWYGQVLAMPDDERGRVADLVAAKNREVADVLDDVEASLRRFGVD